ncbi:NAD(P)/FAD-dependent oxidoreductase, partial [Streptococcus suis]
RLNAKGAVFFRCDAHLYPNKLMQQLIAALEAKGVEMIREEKIIGFETKSKQITKVKTNKQVYDTDTFVLASGSWSREMAAQLNIRIPLMPGRGY